MGTYLTHPIVLLSLGGAVGTNARYWLGVWIKQHTFPLHFPWATFVINVTGSLILGIAAVLFLGRDEPGPRAWYLVLGIGFCGGYTTFSTFALETFDLFRKGQTAWAVAYVVASLLSATLAVAAAVLVTEHFIAD